MSRMTLAELRAAIQLNMLAFFHLIRVGEGTDGPTGYNMLVIPGGLFEDMTKHPHKLIQVPSHTPDGAAIIIPSTAAGAYQINWPTWTDLVRLYGFEDFTPATQDLAAVALIAMVDAVEDVLAGRVPTAIAKCAIKWASLPGSPYGQPKRSLDQALTAYRTAGGVLSVA